MITPPRWRGLSFCAASTVCPPFVAGFFMRGGMVGMIDHRSQLQADEAKQPAFRWQLSDFLTLFVAFSLTAVYSVNPSSPRWAKYAAGMVVGWWTYRCLKAGRLPNGYHLAVVCVAIGSYVVLVAIIKRVVERGFS